MTMMGINKARETRTSTTRVNNFSNLCNERDSVMNRDNSNKYQETPYAQLEVTTTR
jgi:hypothetical protein